MLSKAMKIKKIRLQNGYKRFFDLTIDLGENPKKIVALIGPNGCGKSSVLDGILFQASAWGSIGNTGGLDHSYHSMNKDPNYSHENVIVELVSGNFRNIRQERVSQGKEKTLISFRSPYRYNNNLNITELRATTSISLNNYGASTTSAIDGKMEENFKRLNIKYNQYLNQTDCKPSEAKIKIIGELNRSIKECLDLEISDLGNIEASRGTLYFKKTDQSVEFEFNVLSSGEKEVVDILLDFYLRQDEYTDTIFLLDEPELHINTSIQKKLLIEINKLIGQDCQLWVTTHSIGFLRALQDELKDQCQIIPFKDGMNLASTSHTLIPIKKTAAEWRKIFEIALDDLAHLISPKKIIYCEGSEKPGKDNQEQGLDSQVFNTIFSEKYHDCLFVSAGGNTELEQRSAIAFSILSKVFSTVEIFVLKDRDFKSGKFVTQNDREVYLSTRPTHRVLKRWEIENYLYDKEVLKKYCNQESLIFNEDSYDKFVTDIENQNLKDVTGTIKVICGIINSLNPEMFKRLLAQQISEDMHVFKDLESCIFI